MRRGKTSIDIPYLPPAKVVNLPGRGEIMVRHHQHADTSRPTLLLLHGWTASADTQFFTAYAALTAEWSVVTVDHRGHGRGLRPDVPFSLEDCADDAADVVRALGVDKVVTVGYSMGGPISLLFWQRHAALVEAMVLEATALEWNATRAERVRWHVGRALSPVVRRVVTPTTVRFGLRKAIPRGHEIARYVPWLVGEIRRNDPWQVSEAGRALSHFDARPFAGAITVPTAMVLTTGDRLVRPGKQQALAEAISAEVVELSGDHFAPLSDPREFADATRRAVDLVVRRSRAH